MWSLAPLFNPVFLPAPPSPLLRIVTHWRHGWTIHRDFLLVIPRPTFHFLKGKTILYFQGQCGPITGNLQVFQTSRWGRARVDLEFLVPGSMGKCLQEGNACESPSCYFREFWISRLHVLLRRSATANHRFGLSTSHDSYIKRRSRHRYEGQSRHKSGVIPERSPATLREES